MEAIRTLIRGALPPVGRPIVVSAGSHINKDLPRFDGYEPHWVDSGTSALALALVQAKQQRPEVCQPEVILPGYCCPDLVAAAHYAGVKPVLVDIQPNDPALALGAIRRALSPSTLALVAVNFLGVAENLAELLLLKRDFPQLMLVEDNAQWFPSAREIPLLAGDFVVFSFGRGKPVSLLGGGLLLTKQPLAAELAQGLRVEGESAAPSVAARVLLQLKYRAYNQLLTPFCYQFLSRNPFITLGQTQYHALLGISALDAQRAALLGANLQAFAQAETRLADAYQQLFDAIGFENQFAALSSNRCRRLLRYPVLFKTAAHKQRVLKRLTALGLGATDMYRTALPSVAGVGELAVSDALPNAIDFAARFITLPLHVGVGAQHLQLIRRAFAA